jgi:predicted ATP-dependent serine protease
METSFVGRQQEQELIGWEFQTAVAGHTRVAFIAGEPGIGKSRLLRQAANRAQEQGAFLLQGAAVATEGSRLTSYSWRRWAATSAKRRPLICTS